MINKILKILNENNEFISGEYIANKLGITRAGVSKNISKLKNMGYEITSINNKGHLLKKENNIYSAFEITKNLNTNFLGKNCHFLEEIDSTNLYAKKLIYENAPNGTIIVSNFQTKGKGRFEKTWLSEKNVGIYLSLILNPKITIIHANNISLISGIALCRILSLYDINPKIKWPNDIILNNKKVAGILTEIISEIEVVNNIILGIGINVNNKSFDKSIKEKATSLYLELGKKLDRRTIIQQFLNEFEKMYTEFIQNLDFKIFLEEYKNLCINLNQNVKLKYKEKEISGKVIDVTEYGALIFLSEENEQIQIVSGEVSIRKLDGTYI